MKCIHYRPVDKYTLTFFNEKLISILTKHNRILLFLVECYIIKMYTINYYPQKIYRIESL